MESERSGKCSEVGGLALHEKIRERARVGRGRKFHAKFCGDELDAIPSLGSPHHAADGKRAFLAENVAPWPHSRRP